MKKILTRKALRKRIQTLRQKFIDCEDMAISLRSLNPWKADAYERRCINIWKQLFNAWFEYEFGVPFHRVEAL